MGMMRKMGGVLLFAIGIVVLFPAALQAMVGAGFIFMGLWTVRHG